MTTVNTINSNNLNCVLVTYKNMFDNQNCMLKKNLKAKQIKANQIDKQPKQQTIKDSLMSIDFTLPDNLSSLMQYKIPNIHINKKITGSALSQLLENELA